MNTLTCLRAFVLAAVFLSFQSTAFAQEKFYGHDWQVDQPHDLLQRDYPIVNLSTPSGKDSDERASSSSSEATLDKGCMHGRTQERNYGDGNTYAPDRYERHPRWCQWYKI